jgi:hypothetical protein
MDQAPTAIQGVDLAHETPVSSLGPLPSLGLATRAQALPFQLSTSVPFE